MDYLIHKIGRRRCFRGGLHKWGFSSGGGRRYGLLDDAAITSENVGHCGCGKVAGSKKNGCLLLLSSTISIDNSIDYCKCNFPMSPSFSRWVVQSVCHNFLKDCEVTHLCSYRSTCFKTNKKNPWLNLKSQHKA